MRRSFNCRWEGAGDYIDFFPLASSIRLRYTSRTVDDRAPVCEPSVLSRTPGPPSDFTRIGENVMNAHSTQVLAESATAEQSKPASTGLHAVAPSERVVSVDALRGFDMFWIAGGAPFVMEFFKLFANPLPPWLGGQFEHTPWVGFDFWDIIMPLFLFIVGVAMPFSIGKRVERGASRASIYRKVAYRVVVLWVLGMVAQGHLLLFTLGNFQIYSNTLQSIAAGYL